MLLKHHIRNTSIQGDVLKHHMEHGLNKDSTYMVCVIKVPFRIIAVVDQATTKYELCTYRMQQKTVVSYIRITRKQSSSSCNRQQSVVAAKTMR